MKTFERRLPELIALLWLVTLPAHAGSPGDYPLLGSAHGGHVWGSFCEGKPDEALLPPDPRTLVQPGANAGRAVYFNEYYRECHANAAPEDAAPKTCGDWRSRVARGATLLKGNGAIGAGNVIGGNYDDGALGFAFNSDTYNNLWRTWGFWARPGNYDQWVAERYGWPLSQERNPYPLPGEDPNRSNGGSGQLPAALTQLRDSNGRWTGRIGLTCNACHSGKVGDPGEGTGLGQIYGTNSLSDIGVFVRDLGVGLVGLPAAALPFTFNKTRGTGNITNYQLLEMLWLLGDLPATLHLNQSLIFAHGGGSEDAPAWWNFGHRVVKFFDGSRSVDAQRILLQAYDPLFRVGKLTWPFNQSEVEAWVEQHDQDADAWIMSLKSPAYPGPIDQALAEKGAVLFHTKDLWAPELANPVPKPAGGNGSCASCHGVYSPRYAHDPAFLASPALEGIAAYRVPLQLINTDPKRAQSNDANVAAYNRYSWNTYPAKPGEPGQCEVEGFSDPDKMGYLAPPLYGVWASAPYFHNGSVPTVWDVLKPADRPAIWRRVSAPRLSGLSALDQLDPTKAIMGYDTRFARAYDQAKLGWKYDVIACGGFGTTAYVDCNPYDPGTETLLQTVLDNFMSNVALGWNLLSIPIFGSRQIEERKIYNTGMYSQSNSGHKAAAVLTDDERRAIIEYLKTL